MKLIVDIGNSRTKLTLFDNKDIKALETVDQIDLPVLKAFAQRNGTFSKSILSSVIHHTMDINKYLADIGGFIELTHTTPLPFTSEYKSPETLGKDRIAAVAGGKAQFPGKNLLIIDAGTAITYDLLTSDGRYLGGGISPGIGLRFKALHDNTGKLPLVEPRYDTELIGQTTKDSILSGVINGTKAEVTGIISGYKQQFDELHVILTGGDHNYFDNSPKSNIFALPNLVLDGLNEILDFNE